MARSRSKAKRKPRGRRPVRAGRRTDSRGRPVRAARTKVAGHLSTRSAEVIGVGLIVLALLTVLGLWFRAGGPFGKFFLILVKGLFGPAGYGFPVMAAFWAVLLLRGTATDDRGRMLVGLWIALFGALGLASLARSNPSPAAGYDAVSRAGGLLGAAVAWPLSRVVSAYGAAVVCLGLVFLGVLVFTATPLSAVGRGLRKLFAGGAARPQADEESEPPERRRRTSEGPEEATGMAPIMAEPEPAVIAEAKQIRLPLRPGGAGYRLPPLELLRRAPASTADARDAEHTMAALERTFQNFGVPARVTAAHRGPTVTMYEVEVEAGTKVNKVLSLGDDIAYALATPDVRIIAPIPGKSAIGVEVPNKVRDFVMLGDVLSSKAAREVSRPLYVGLGKDVHGRSVLVNLGEMQNVLIAGATGAGKSSLINTFVTSLLVRTTPDDVKIMLVDPKRVELSHFADVPHLLSPVIVQPKRAAEALGWVVREMELRYESFAAVGMRDIEAYNTSWTEGTLRIPPGQEAGFGRLPYILVVIDELADLMMVAPRDVEDAICRVA